MNDPTILDGIIKSLADPSRMQLYMGELDENEKLVATASIRYTLTQLDRLGYVIYENRK